MYNNFVPVLFQMCCNAPKPPKDENGKKKECMQEVGSKLSITGNVVID